MGFREKATQAASSFSAGYLEAQESTMAKNIQRIIQADTFGLLVVAVPLSYLLIMIFFILTGDQYVAAGEKTRLGMPMRHYVCFTLAAGIFCVWIAGAGVILYFNIGVADQYTMLAEDTFYARSTFVENHIFLPMFVFQGYNTIFSLFFKQTRDTVMIIHHVSAVLTSVVAMAPFLQHDAFFFFGMAELSNIPLTWIDLTRQMPSLRENYKQVHAFFQLFFVIVFLLIRCVIWPVRVLFVMYRISLFVYRGLIHSVPVAYGFMGTTMLLTALQLVWGRKILFLAIRSYGGDDKAKTK
jgi:hypothetical protein